jgi:photosystem II stability/assembly factor-like uncharacterized protein
MFKRPGSLLFAIALSLNAETPLENTGKPIHVVYECTQADTQAAGIGCSEEEPCPVYLELANVETIGSKLFVTGNIHTPMATLYSILLASDDAGKTWNEPHPRIRSAGLDQIQFFDAQHGWISGANLQTAPRDPFFLISTDGGATWRQQPIFEETRVAAIERYRFLSPSVGSLLIDATLDNGKHELYQTRNGGESWMLQEGSADPEQLFPERQTGAQGHRLRTDAGTRSYVIEEPDNNHWKKVASFLVNIATCKE